MFTQYNDSLSKMHNKLFYPWIALCLVANIIGTVFNYIAKGWIPITKVCFFVGVLMVIVTVISVILKKKEFASIVIFLLLTWIEFPALYTVYREIVIAYFLLSLFAGTIFIPLKWYFTFASTSVVWYGFVIWYVSRSDTLLTILYNEMTYLIVAIAMIVIQGCLLFYYERQKKELNEAKAQIEYTAAHDVLTGLYNRRYLMDELNLRMSEKKVFALAMIDIDNFKRINDTYGHQMGDAVLENLGKFIREALPEGSYSARYGGEEIVLVFEGLEIPECNDRLKTIRDNIYNTFSDRISPSVTFSGGLVKSETYESVDMLIKAADEKLYVAKGSGKDRIVT